MYLGRNRSAFPVAFNLHPALVLSYLIFDFAFRRAFIAAVLMLVAI